MEIYSFDIFDTCIIRSVGSFRRLFYLVGENLINEPNKFIKKGKVENFVELRIQAEILAQQYIGSKEPNIIQVWDTLTNLDPSFTSDGFKVEIEIEKKYCIANKKILTAVKEKIKDKAKIIYISDTYYSREILYDLLTNAGYDANIENIYSSSDLGCSKKNGELFKLIQKQNCYNYQNWYHFGDNISSDFYAPKKLGIRCTLETSSYFNNKESRLINKLRSDKHAVDFIYALRGYRLFYNVSCQNKIDYVVLRVIGPLLIVYAIWVLKLAREFKQNQLLFCSRDTRLLFEVCKNLTCLSSGIDLKYFYISRQAITMPKIFLKNDIEIDWLFRNFETPTLFVILNKLNLTYDEIRPHLRQNGLSWSREYLIKSEKDKSRLLKLLKTEYVFQKLIAKSKTQFEYIYQYLNSLTQNNKYTSIVDVGWYANGLEFLNKILNRNGNNNIGGFFLGLNRGRKQIALKDNANAMFYREKISSFDIPSSSIFGNETLLEHLLGIADHGSVHSYFKNECGEITSVTQNISSENKLFYTDVEKSILQISKYFSYYHKDLLTTLNVDICIKLFEELFTDIKSFPDESILKHLQDIDVSVHPNNEYSRKLIYKISFLELFNTMFTFSTIKSKSPINWTDARIEISPFYIKSIYKTYLFIRTGIKLLLNKIFN